MLDKARSNSIMLSTYNLEKRKDGWYFWKAPFFTAEARAERPLWLDHERVHDDRPRAGARGGSAIQAEADRP